MQLDAEIADCSAIIEAYKRDEALNVALVGIYRAEGAANLIATIYRQRANAYTRRSNPELARTDLTAAATLSADRDLSAPVDRPGSTRRSTSAGGLGWIERDAVGRYVCSPHFIDVVG